MKRYKTVKGLLGGIDKLFSDQFRWIKGHFYEERKTPAGKTVACFCLMGALNQLAGNATVKDQAIEKLQKAIRARTHRPSDIIDFNDAKGTTIDGIRSVVSKALAAA